MSIRELTKSFKSLYRRLTLSYEIASPSHRHSYTLVAWDPEGLPRLFRRERDAVYHRRWHISSDTYLNDANSLMTFARLWPPSLLEQADVSEIIRALFQIIDIAYKTSLASIIETTTLEYCVLDGDRKPWEHYVEEATRGCQNTFNYTEGEALAAFEQYMAADSE